MLHNWDIAMHIEKILKQPKMVTVSIEVLFT